MRGGRVPAGVTAVTIPERILVLLNAGPLDAFELCDRMPDAPMHEVRIELERLADAGKVRATDAMFRPTVWSLRCEGLSP